MTDMYADWIERVAVDGVHAKLCGAVVARLREMDEVIADSASDATLIGKAYDRRLVMEELMAILQEVRE